MLKLAAYADRLSVRPGETIRFHVANATAADVAARLVRVRCADPNPAGPGVQIYEIGHRPHTITTPKAEAVARGSYAIAETPGLRLPAETMLSATILPTRLNGREQSILRWQASDGSLQLDLSIDAHNCVRATVRDEDGVVTVAADKPLAEHEWVHVWLLLSDSELWVRRYRASERGDGSSIDTGEEAEVTFRPRQRIATGGRLFIGGLTDAEGTSAFCGRIEAAAIVSEGEVPQTIARWDLGAEPHSQRIIDTGPHGFHGRLMNTPTRAVTGSTWTGREMCFRHAPAEYGAIHFHDDDIDDCRWPATHEWTVPADVASGNYALMLEAGAEKENVPFFVVPPKGTATARLAVLVSTYTYTVYGNHTRPEWSADPQWQATWKRQAAVWTGAYPHNPGDHPEYGLSTYNYHTDGTGIAHASWHRPMLNFRIGYVTYPYPDIRGSGLRHYPADTHLTAWLEAKGIAYDLITDVELHAEGAELLNRYTCVLTGTHPEYHTREMLDALTTYRDGGGRLCYFGGNGFYWKIALDPERSGHVEIRRGEGGIRAWAADPGEYYNQFDGEYGGLWRRNGRPPQQLVGVGFTAQGNFVGSHYRRTAASRDRSIAWIFAGVEGDVIGDFGLSGHGAAGFELDRADQRLGTPANAVVIAQSENHPPDAPWVLVPEEQLTHLVTLPGGPAAKLIRADMTFFTAAAGKGAVFSTGSITYCGSLPVNGFDNSVSRLTENVVRRFLDPTPFK